MKSLSRLLNRHIALVTILLIVGLWQICGNLGLLPKFVLPTPLKILEAFVLRRDLLLHHSKYTILEALLGITYGVILAWTLALIMDAFSLLNRALYPLLVIIQSVPTTALAPLLILWLGYGMTPKIVLIVITTTFPIVVSILDGFRHTDKDLIKLLRLMKANTWQILWHVKIPNSLTYFYAGLRVSVSYAFIAAVVSEWLGGFDGLGIYMIMSKKMFEYETMFAIIILISVISLLAMALVSWSERYFIKWKFIGDHHEDN